jgi:general nucleoside transport system permease protein
MTVGEASPEAGRRLTVKANLFTRGRHARLVRLLMLYAVSIAVALFIAAMLVLIVGGAPTAVATSIYQGSLGTAQSISETITTATPVLLIGTGALMAVRAGMFNIGQQGQLEIGLIASAFVLLKMHGPGPMVVVIALVAATVGGGLWAGISAVLRFLGNVNVVLSSLLLIYVADQLLAYVLSSPQLLEMKGPNGQAGNAAVSPILGSAVQLPNVISAGQFTLGLGTVLALGVFVIGWAALQRGRWGRHVRIIGLSADVSTWIGLRVATIAGGALVISGALAGFAGGVMLTGSAHQVSVGFAGDIPTDGLLAALIVADNPLFLLPVALFFGVIESGGGFLLSDGVPFYFAQILEGLLVMAVIFPRVYELRHQLARRVRGFLLPRGPATPQAGS